MATGNAGGRPRKPTPIKVAQGTYRADRDNPNAPQWPAGDPEDVPSWLDDVGKNEWRRLAPLLVEKGLLPAAGTASNARAMSFWRAGPGCFRTCQNIDMGFTLGGDRPLSGSHARSDQGLRAGPGGPVPPRPWAQFESVLRWKGGPVTAELR